MTFFQIKDLSKSYGEYKALDNVSLNINEGEIVALIGKNGAGKTTLLNCIAGNISSNQGEIRYKDTNLLCENSLLNEFGILIEANFFDYLNAYDNLSLLMKASGFNDKSKIKNTVNNTLKLVGLEGKRKSYVKSFSFGMKQRLGLAQTLIHNPRFLVLDEPFVGLDPLGKKMLKEVITKKAREEKVGVLFSSHDLDDVSEICDRVVMINKGKKVFDNVFLYKKTYVLVCREEIPSNIKSYFLEKFYGKINVLENIVEFLEPILINDILSCLFTNKIEIIDIASRENSLYDFFKNEVEI